MNQVTDQQIIEILRKEAVPALGCTEPVACALACAKCKEVLGGVPERLDVLVSGNIYKNGMGVGIPGTGMVGLPIAAALGAVCGKSEYGLEVLKEVNVGDNLQRAKDMLGQVTVSLKEDAPDKLYAEALATKGNDTVKVIIAHTHTNIVLVEKNGEEIFKREFRLDTSKPEDKGPELSVKRIWDFVHEVDVKDIEFVLQGAEMNKAISAEGLNSEYGLQIGKTLKQLARALALSNLIAVHIHHYMGHLSALCGILIAGTGAASAITYLMGGTYDNMVNTIKTMCSNLTGMMCDGAKQGCALKVYSGVSAAVQAALLSMRGIKTNNDGIVEEDIERTIRNVGLIGTKGMEETDKTILNIMCNKK